MGECTNTARRCWPLQVVVDSRVHQPFLVTKPYHGKATAYHKYVVKWGRFDIKDEWTVCKKTQRY